MVLRSMRRRPVFFPSFPVSLIKQPFLMTDIQSDKDRLRKKYRAARKRAHEAGAHEAARRLAENFLAARVRDHMDFSGVVATYAAMASEIDTMPLSLILRNDGYDLALPVVVETRAPLIFRRWRPGDDLMDGPHATRHPNPDAPVVTPGVVLAPLVAFDRFGGRLGQGQGYYDRTLKSLRAAGHLLAVGLAFAVQEADSLPHGGFDEPLDWVVTEKETIRCGEGKR